MMGEYMQEITLRIPWNKKVAIATSLVMLALAAFVYVFLTHGLESYRIGFKEEGLIVTLRDDMPFERDFGERDYVCLDRETVDRLYRESFSSGFGGASFFYDKTGKYVSAASSDDVGLDVQWEGPAVEVLPMSCQRVPKWFFNMKTEKRPGA